MDVSNTEILFAQKLSSCEPRIRQKALHRLRKWLISRVDRETNFTNQDFIKLWKGLYYCLWMQDKPLLQEELAENICGLRSCFASRSDQLFLWISTFYETMGREWYKIDRWRMDKFMMLMRKFLRSHLDWLRSESWIESLVAESITTWSDGVLSGSGECAASALNMPSGLRYHFTAIFLDELDIVAGDSLTKEQVIVFLQPFAKLLTDKTISDYFFKTIVSEVFESILLQRSQDMLADQGFLSDDESMEREDGSDEQGDGVRESVQSGKKLTKSAGIQFDYGAIADLIFEFGKAAKISNSRRKVFYDLVKKYRSAHAGENPMVEYVSSGDEFEIKNKEIEKEARKLLRKRKQENTKMNKPRKSQNTGDGIEVLAGVASPSIDQSGFLKKNKKSAFETVNTTKMDSKQPSCSPNSQDNSASNSVSKQKGGRYFNSKKTSKPSRLDPGIMTNGDGEGLVIPALSPTKPSPRRLRSGLGRNQKYVKLDCTEHTVAPGAPNGIPAVTPTEGEQLDKKRKKGVQSFDEFAANPPAFCKKAVDKARKSRSR